MSLILVLSPMVVGGLKVAFVGRAQSLGVS